MSAGNMISEPTIVSICRVIHGHTFIADNMKGDAEMEIVKKGKEYKREFSCDQCECVFTAKIGEYLISRNFPSGLRYSVICPYCRHIIDRQVKQQEAEEYSDINAIAKLNDYRYTAIANTCNSFSSFTGGV